MGDKLRVAISWITHHEDGPSFGYDHAKIDCPRCEEAGGWTGTDSELHCPYGCGVRIVSIQAEEDALYSRESRAREAVRRDYRAVRKAQRLVGRPK